MATRLTKSVIDAASPKEARYTLWDTEVRGLGLRVSPSGRKTFVCFYRTYDGSQRRPTVGSPASITVSQARALAQDMIEQSRMGPAITSGARDNKNGRSSITAKLLRKEADSNEVAADERATEGVDQAARSVVSSNDEALTDFETAELLGLSVFTVRAYRKNGGGPPFRKYGTSKQSPIRYLRSEVIAWRDALVMTSTSGAGK